MNPPLPGLTLLLALWAANPTPVHAQNALREEAIDTALLSNAAFQQGHPDLRFRNWAELSAEERERAIGVGRGLYAEYGDEVAKPRLEKVLFKERRSLTGSHTGSLTGNLTVSGSAGNRARVQETINEGTSFRGERFYDETYWEPELYWAWHAKVFEKASEGTVRVGDLRLDPDAASDDDDGG